MASCWGITGGSAGMAAQVAALAAALNITPIMKNVTVAPPLAWLPNSFFPGWLDKWVVPYGLTRNSDTLAAPWPDLVISCGRRGAIAALGLKIRLRFEADTKFIHIQDPHVDPKHFDLVVAMEHDRIKGENVIKTRYALHAITPAALAMASARFSRQFVSYPKPHIAVLLGGTTNKYKLHSEHMQDVITQLKAAFAHTSGSLLITPSRRTGQENIDMLKQTFGGNPRVYIYDFVGDNPYMGMLALADEIVVTNDSVNMMSEAHATGKPIYILPLPEHEGTKPERFAERLMDEGIARPLGSSFEYWSYKSDNEMIQLAAEVKRRLNL